MPTPTDVRSVDLARDLLSCSSGEFWKSKMIFSLEQALGIHPAALEFRSTRGQLLAENLANDDTPNYKARDVSFQSVLDSAGAKRLKLQRTHEGHLAPPDEAPLVPKYRVPLHSSLDGNTVTTHVEQAEFMENAMRYQASLMFLNRRLSGLKAALSDQ